MGIFVAGVEEPERSDDALALSDLLGTAVVDADGRRRGRLVDVVVDLAEPLPRVAAIIARAHARRCVVPISRLTGMDRGRIVVPSGLHADAPVPPHGLFLRRDVLDAQVVDVHGRRTGRVGDVELERSAGGLRAVAVDLGLRSVLHRLGMRRVARHAPRDAVAWRDVHLLSARGHRLQLRSDAAAIHRLGPEGLAHVAARLPAHRARELLDRLPDGHPLRARQRHFGVMRHRRRAPA